MDTIIQYIKSWFPAKEQQRLKEDFSRKRRGSDLHQLRSPKVRKVLSPMANYFDEDLSMISLNGSLDKQASRTIVIDDDDDHLRFMNGKSRKGNSENRPKLLESIDLTSTDGIKTVTEKRRNSRTNGFEYITKFSSPKLPSPRLTSSQKSSPHFKNPRLDSSFRLEEKRKYRELLDTITTTKNPFNIASFYGTAMEQISSRSRRMLQLAQFPKKPVQLVDLTKESSKLSTKERVIKILDDFEDEPEVIEDYDSDVEILPNPPSPKPDIKVEPVNSLKTVVDTSKVGKLKWLEEFSRQRDQAVEEKNREIKVYREKSAALEEINRELLIKSLTRKVEESLSIKDTILPVIEIEEEIELPILTGEQLQIVKRAFSGDPNEVLTKKFNLNVNRRDMQTLAKLNWLNDNIINFYMNLLMERGTGTKWPKCYAMNTFFYQKLMTSGPESLKRWTRRVDIFAHDFICVPIHLGMHWCMAIINLKEKTIKYYDSMGKPNDSCLNALRNYLEFEHQDKKGQPFSTKDFQLENVEDIPQQMNGSDCGMFACTFAEFASRKAKFSFSQNEMPYLRRKMVVEIITGELLIQ